MRKRKQASMRLGPVGIEELLGSSKSEDPTKNLPKTIPKIFQNLPKTIQKSIQNPPKINSWSSLGSSWPPLGSSWRQEALKNERRSKNRSSAMLALCWARLCSKSAWEPHLVNLYIKTCI